ncbi:ATP-binding protein [Streptomyces sp. NPDC127084]|uniref:ATP-binding protein n=1 Tax=Streptomyces sp. NPDC127084 TaxID=3347133 RepID=UPI00366253CE
MPDNIPADLTSMVGRRAEVAHIRQTLSTSRLVTITGVGGVGKTRLALQVARRLRRAFPDGVWLVSLAELRDQRLMDLTVMQAVGMPTAGAEPRLALIDFLKCKRLLLIFDNCEHLIDASAQQVADLLRACPDIQIMITSREPLGVEGEYIFTVSPLAIPASRGSRMSEFEQESVTLFKERAAAVLPGFALTEKNRGAVEELCRRLDGLPLAIELAAVRMRALSPENILARLNSESDLRCGYRTAPVRQQSLRGAIDWSFRLCTEQEHLMWARLSVFTGNCDLAAVEYVCSGEGIDRSTAADLIASLVDKSIVIREEVDGVPRYRQLEVIRQYGIDRLREKGGELELRIRHRDYYMQFAKQGERQWFGRNQIDIFKRLCEEQANIRAALEFCITQEGQVDFGMYMAGSLWPYWLMCGLQREGQYWLNRALTHPQRTERSEHRIVALWGRAFLDAMLDDMPAALDALTTCQRLAYDMENEPYVAHSTYLFGLARLHDSDPSSGLALLQEGLEREKALSQLNPHLHMAQLLVGYAACLTGKPDLAIDPLQDCEMASREHGDIWLLSWVYIFLGLSNVLRGEPEQAESQLQDGLRLKVQLGDLLGVASSIEYLAWVAMDQGDAERCVRLLGGGHVLWTPLAARLGGFPPLIRWHNEYAQKAREFLGEQDYLRLHGEASRLGVDEIISYASGREEAAMPKPATQESNVLTRRERQIAKLLAEGLSNKDIAAKLVIAPRTAEGHVAHILTKLGLNSRLQVAAWFSRQ